jgi:TRAP-type transport system periplasmic protein
MGKKVFLFILVVLGLVFFTNSFSTTCFAAEPSKPKILKFATGGITENSFFGQHYKWWAEEVERRTGGRVKVQIFWMESLVKGKDMLPAIQSGYTDIGWVVSLLFPKNFPLYPVIDHLGNYTKNYAAGLLAAKETLEREPNLKAEMEKQKVIMVAPYTSGQFIAISKQCFNSVTELKGKVVRVAGGLRAQYWKNIGTNPVSIAMADSYEALDRGTVSVLCDCTASIIQAFKLYEVGKCMYVDLPFMPLAVAVFMNLDVFRQLPKDIQDIMMQLSTDYALRFGKALTDFEKDFMHELETKHRVKFIYPSPEDRKILLEAAKKAEDDMLKKLESEGQMGGRKVIDYYQNALQKYEKEMATGK